jgi:hypothetical protein
MASRVKKWKFPSWMSAYLDLIQGARTPDQVEDCMNDHDTLVQVNAPRAMNVVAVKSKVFVLEKLHEKGLIL